MALRRAALIGCVAVCCRVSYCRWGHATLVRRAAVWISVAPTSNWCSRWRPARRWRRHTAYASHTAACGQRGRPLGRQAGRATATSCGRRAAIRRSPPSPSSRRRASDTSGSAPPTATATWRRWRPRVAAWRSGRRRSSRSARPRSGRWSTTRAGAGAAAPRCGGPPAGAAAAASTSARWAMPRRWRASATLRTTRPRSWAAGWTASSDDATWRTRRCPTCRWCSVCGGRRRRRRRHPPRGEDRAGRRRSSPAWDSHCPGSPARCCPAGCPADRARWPTGVSRRTLPRRNRTQANRLRRNRTSVSTAACRRRLDWTRAGRMAGRQGARRGARRPGRRWLWGGTPSPGLCRGSASKWGRARRPAGRPPSRAGRPSAPTATRQAASGRRASRRSTASPVRRR